MHQSQIVRKSGILVLSLLALSMGLLVIAQSQNKTARANVDQGKKNDNSVEKTKPSADDSLGSQLPRIRPLEPAEALKAFQVAKGFRIELVAAEPLVRDPVAMSFDESGRLYIIEMCDYSEQKNDFLGTIKLLEDTNGDGIFDKSTMFADNLSWPTAIFCYDGGVFVGAAPDILYLKDTNGDKKSDERKVIFTGFGRSNVQGLLNSFQWSPDCRIYGATNSSGGTITSPANPKMKPVNSRGQDFSFDPRTFDFRTESGGAQHGLSFDDWGHRFVSHNSNHLQMIIYDNRYAARNPLFAMPPSRMNISADGPSAEVFRISAAEKWRELRTDWRATGKAKGPVEANGKSTGYFTSATGVTIYRGDAYGESALNTAFVGDVSSNLVHRKKLEPDGVKLIGKRIDKQTEFVASTDTWFRPVQFGNAPDGTLYILDMYREVIEHPDAIPAEIKKHLDLTSGRDRGRIYRVVPDNFKQRPLPQLAKATNAELIKMLEHPNGWHRDTAARLLYERVKDKQDCEALAALAISSPSPKARIQALHLHQAIQANWKDSGSREPVIHALSDPHPRVREHALRLIGRYPADERIKAQLKQLASDDDLGVRFQLAFTLGSYDDSRYAMLSQLAKTSLNDSWIQAAILSSLNEGSSFVLAELAKDKSIASTPAGKTILENLAKQVALHRVEEEIKRTEETLVAAEASNPAAATAIVRGLASQQSAKRPLSKTVTAILEKLLISDRKLAADESAAADARGNAIETLSLDRFENISELLEKLVKSDKSSAVQIIAIKTLGEFNNDRVMKILIESWPTMTPRLRTAASDVLFSRKGWIVGLFDAIEANEIPVTDIDFLRLKSLSTAKDVKIRNRALNAMKQMQVSDRKDVLKEYAAAKTLTGDPAKGKIVFQKTCTPCHKLEGVGHEVGPNLAQFKNRGIDAIYENVLDPNKEVGQDYVNYSVETKSGRSYNGMVVQENENSVVLLRGEGETQTILRSDIDKMQRSAMSIMPEGLEKNFQTPQVLADLMAYIMSVK